MFESLNTRIWMGSVHSSQDFADYVQSILPFGRALLSETFWAFRGTGAQRLAELAAKECIEVMVPDEELVRHNLGILAEAVGNDYVLLFTKPSGQAIPNAELEQELVVWRANDGLIKAAGFTLPF